MSRRSIRVGPSLCLLIPSHYETNLANLSIKVAHISGVSFERIEWSARASTIGREHCG